MDLDLFKQAGYGYNYWFSAQKKGYSGVAVLCKKEPKHIEYGTGIESMDFEGRNIRVDYDDISVMSLYLPSGTNSDRLSFKYEYMDLFLDYITELKKSVPNLVITGDFNICRTEIDIHNPKTNKNTSGFLPEERAWLATFIDSGFVDSLRHINKEPHVYSWWSYRANARNNNKGWRIDYQMVNGHMIEQIENAGVLPQAKHSDHCPTVLEIKTK